MAPPAGQLPHRITVNQLTETQDALNQPIQSWSSLGTFWGRYENLTGREAAIAKQIRATASGKVTFRNLSFEINEQMQLVFEDQTLGIVNINNRDDHGRRSQVVCFVEEIRSVTSLDNPGSGPAG